MSVMQKCIPKRIVPVDQPTPWIDHDIQHDIRLRERLFKWFKASKCQDWLVKYKAVHNLVVSKIRSAKQAFFQRLCSTRSSPKKLGSAMWSLKPNKSPSSTVLTAGSISYCYPQAAFGTWEMPPDWLYFLILKRPLIAYPTRPCWIDSSLNLHSQSTPTSTPLAHELSEHVASTSCFEWCRVIVVPS